MGEEGIVITKPGKPVAKLIPIRTESAELIGKLKGRLNVKGDIFSTGLKWRVDAGGRPGPAPPRFPKRSGR